MIYGNVWDYKNSSKNDYGKFNSFIDSNENGFGISNSFESKITGYYNELLRASKIYGLGDNITVETAYEGNVPEKVFTINLNHKRLTDDDFHCHEQILNHMNEFAKRNDMVDFAKDTYIILG